MTEREPERATIQINNPGSEPVEVVLTRKGTTWSNDEPVALHPFAEILFSGITLRNGERISILWHDELD